MALGVLAFIGVHKPTQPIPRRLPVECPDRYVLGLLVRHFQARLGRRARVLQWSKSRDGEARAAAEEASLLGPPPLLVVLGAPRGWAAGVEPARGAHVVSQEPEGKLRGEPYAWQDRALVLSALQAVVGLPWSAGDLKWADWTWCREWSDYEPFLVRGKLLGWDSATLKRQAQARVAGDLFGLMRDGEWWSLRFLAQRYGHEWLQRALVEFTVDVARYQQALRAGVPAERAGKALGLPRWRREQVEDAAEHTPQGKVLEFAARLVRLDPLLARLPEQGLDLAMMGARI